MKLNRRQYGLSLLEETVVVAAVAVIIFLAVPAAKHLFNNIETTAGVKALIGSSLNSAKAIAIRQQQYVGIRFQHACYRDPQGNIQPEKSPLKMPQYMIFVIYRPYKSLNSQQTTTNLFTAIEGIEPIKLPENIGVMDLIIDQTNVINNNTEISTDEQLTDTTSFTIVFSPSGKIVVRDVQIRNRDGYPQTNNTSEDDIFNTEDNVRDEIAAFLQDDYGTQYKLHKEPSRRSFIIYDRNQFRRIQPDKRFDDFLEDLKERHMVYINPYTGTFINR